MNSSRNARDAIQKALLGVAEGQVEIRFLAMKSRQDKNYNVRHVFARVASSTRENCEVVIFIWEISYASKTDFNLPYKPVCGIMLLRGASSSGRARHSHCRGEEFESPALHQGQNPWIFCEKSTSIIEMVVLEWSYG